MWELIHLNTRDWGKQNDERQKDADTINRQQPLLVRRGMEQMLKTVM
jgi:hypothetical protein